MEYVVTTFFAVFVSGFPVFWFHKSHFLLERRNQCVWPDPTRFVKLNTFGIWRALGRAPLNLPPKPGFRFLSNAGGPQGETVRWVGLPPACSALRSASSPFSPDPSLFASEAPQTPQVWTCRLSGLFESHQILRKEPQSCSLDVREPPRAVLPPARAGFSSQCALGAFSWADVGLERGLL